MTGDSISKEISIDENTGSVTGLKIGDAVVKVTVTNENGDTIWSLAEVKVREFLEQAIYSATDNSLTFIEDEVLYTVGSTFDYG